MLCELSRMLETNLNAHSFIIINSQQEIMCHPLQCCPGLVPPVHALTLTSALLTPNKPGPRTQTQKPTGWCGAAAGCSDKSIWGKLSVRNFRSNCLGQNWLLGRANPAAWGWGGQWGANVLMCGRWLGRDNGRISQSPGWLIWDGSSQPLAVGSPIVPLLIPTSHKLQTKVNLFLKGGGAEGSMGVLNIDPCFCRGKWLKNLFVRETADSLTPLPLFMWLYSALCLHPLHLCPLTKGGGDGE